MNRAARRALFTATVAVATLFLAPGSGALALAPPAGVQFGHVARVPKPAPSKTGAGGPCEVSLPVVGGLVSKITGGVCAAAGAVAGLAGQAAEAVGGGVLELLARWMIGAATQVTSFIAKAMAQTTTPQLESAWFEGQFAPMADLGAALALLVALVALGSAATRRSPELLAATLSGVARAGIGTGLMVAMTVMGLSLADQVSGAVLSGSSTVFWKTVAHAWGTSGFGGFGSSALAMLIALVEVLAAVFVWLELVVRGAAIYLAVLFFPAALAAAIWPALSSWPGRLGRLLTLFVLLKPVALIVLSFAGSAAAAGLSFGAGVQGSVGTILAACVIFVLAAFAPWALMYLIAADAESAYVAHQLRTSSAAAISEGRRTFKNASSKTATASNGAGPAGGQSRWSSNGGGGGRGDGGGGGANDGGAGPGGPTGGTGGSSAGEVEGDGTLALGGETVGAGSVGAAAGMAARRLAETATEGLGGGSPAAEDGSGENFKASDQQQRRPVVVARRAVPAERTGGARSGETAGGAAAPSPQREGGSAGNNSNDPQEAPTPARSPRSGHASGGQTRVLTQGRRRPVLPRSTRPAGQRDDAQGRREGEEEPGE